MRRHLVLLPGLLGWLLVTFVAEMATIWSSIEMFHEGWWGSVPHRLVYLVPGFVMVFLAAIPVGWPRAGGWFLGSVGIGLAVFWGRFFDNNLGLEIAAPIVLGAVFFIFEGRRLEKVDRGGLDGYQTPPWVPSHFLFRRPRLTITLGLPLLTLLGVVLTWSFIIFNRIDDGDYGPRRIASETVDLIWAPAGPGWAHGWLQGAEKEADLAAGGRGFYNPSWNQLALYGMEPVGLENDGKIHTATAEDMEDYCLCRYLSEDGLTLLTEPQNLWRMPSIQEVAASLPHHHELADCVWDGTAGLMKCEKRPDKETPLWAPDRSPVYLLTATEADSNRVWFVSYNGRAQQTYKSWGNPRHGFRCVKDPFQSR